MGDRLENFWQHLRKFLPCAASLLLPLLTSCSQSCSQTAPPHQPRNEAGFEALIGQFSHDVERLWGHDELLISGEKDYVRYFDQSQTRSHINFATGCITIETLASTEPKNHLRRAIIDTLLMGDVSTETSFLQKEDEEVNEPNTRDSSQIYEPFDRPPVDNLSQLCAQVVEPTVSDHPWLYEQVVDHQMQPILSVHQANSFSEFLLKNRLNRRISGVYQIWQVTIPLVRDHLDHRAHKYIQIVRQAASQYQIDMGLILAIIHTESSFNPYAVSSANAMGLMQVIPHSAGRDVFERIKNRYGVPAQRYLFNPENNIDTGTAYLHLLQNVYLAGIDNPLSLRYAIISAYNSGVGNVLRTFSDDRKKAVAIINTLSPGDVYRALTKLHPSDQARRYLCKVNRAHKIYRRII